MEYQGHNYKYNIGDQVSINDIFNGRYYCHPPYDTGVAHGSLTNMKNCEIVGYHKGKYLCKSLTVAISLYYDEENFQLKSRYEPKVGDRIVLTRPSNRSGWNNAMDYLDGKIIIIPSGNPNRFTIPNNIPETPISSWIINYENGHFRKAMWNETEIFNLSKTAKPAQKYSKEVGKKYLYDGYIVKLLGYEVGTNSAWCLVTNHPKGDLYRNKGKFSLEDQYGNSVSCDPSLKECFWASQHALEEITKESQKIPYDLSQCKFKVGELVCFPYDPHTKLEFLGYRIYNDKIDGCYIKYFCQRGWEWKYERKVVDEKGNEIKIPAGTNNTWYVGNITEIIPYNSQLEKQKYPYARGAKITHKTQGPCTVLGYSEGKDGSLIHLLLKFDSSKRGWPWYSETNDHYNIVDEYGHKIFIDSETGCWWANLIEVSLRDGEIQYETFDETGSMTEQHPIDHISLRSAPKPAKLSAMKVIPISTDSFITKNRKSKTLISL